MQMCGIRQKKSRYNFNTDSASSLYTATLVYTFTKELADVFAKGIEAVGIW